MSALPIRNPHERVGGLVYFGRMLNKLRLHARGRLPPEYVERLGKGLDGRCCEFLGVKYEELQQAVLAGLADDDALVWCFQQGRRPSEQEIYYFSSWLTKLGWRDKATPILRQQLRDYGLEEHPEIQTIFDVIEADEGRLRIAENETLSI